MVEKTPAFRRRRANDTKRVLRGMAVYPLRAIVAPRAADAACDRRGRVRRRPCRSSLSSQCQLKSAVAVCLCYRREQAVQGSNLPQALLHVCVFGPRFREHGVRDSDFFAEAIVGGL